MRGVILLVATGVIGMSTPSSSTAQDETLSTQTAPSSTSCPPRTVSVGTGCIDKFEASIWETTDRILISKIRNGTVTKAELRAGAIQHGVVGDDYGLGCPNTGAGCIHFYAVSIKGVKPSAYMTWFQAAAAARNSNKRLPTNAEWQVAALGTPDPGVDNETTSCNVNGLPSTDPVPTGSRSNCVSAVGAFAMVGNLREWVADWVPKSAGCADWQGFSDDEQCLSGVNTFGAPGALLRGGDYQSGPFAGVFSINGGMEPHSDGAARIGFRAIR